MYGRAITFGLPAGGVSGLSSASPAPSATNPLITADALLQPANGTSIYTPVASAANAEILPAPAAGYYNLVRYVHVINLSGVATAGYQVKESTSRVIMGSTTTALAANAATQLGGQVVAGALTGYATGTGNLLFIVSYSKIAAANIGFYQAVLTDTYQTLFTVPAGYSATWSWNFAGAFSGELFVMNVDTAATTPIFRITRGANAYLRTNSAVNANVRGAQSGLPDVINGDVVECKCLAAPTAGTVILSGIYSLVPVTT